VGYVLKRYPRLSETFIVNEILAHESAGLPVEIFSLRRPSEEPRHDMVNRIKAPVTYLHSDEIGIKRFWNMIRQCAELFPNLWQALDETRYKNAKETYQALWLAICVKDKGITHLHAHFASGAANVARLASQLTGISFSLTAHAKDIYCRHVDKSSLCRTLNQANALVTVSDYNVDYIAEQLSDVTTQVKRVYNGLPLQDFVYQSPEKRANNIVAVGRLIEKKGFEVLVKACKHMHARRKDFSCFIIGDGPLREDLLQLVSDLELSEHIELCGPRSQTETKRYMQQAAVMAAPCVVSDDGDRDGLPTVLMESMALGTPCVATDVTGIPEIVIDGETGLIVPQHDAQSLADALCRLLDNPPLRVELSSAARRLIEREFDIHKNSEIMRSFILANCHDMTAAGAHRRKQQQDSESRRA
jgi:glycosyltransferase involved in cell wall biosynthesis